jgi:hypothetical protein
MTILYVGNLICVHFNFLPAVLAHVPNSLVRGCIMYSYMFPIIKIIFVVFVKTVQQNSSLGCERLHMVGLDDCSISQPGHLVGSRLSRVHDLISVQNLSFSRLRVLN